MSTHGLHSRLSVSACDRCPLASLSSEAPIRQLQAKSDAGPMQFVVDCDPDECPTNACKFACSDGAIDLIQLGNQAVGRAEFTQCGPTDGDCAGDCGCLLAGLDGLPIEPRQMELDGGTVSMEFTLQDRDELETVVAGLREAGLDVTLESVTSETTRDDASGLTGASMVALSELTPRQREVAATAVAMGYFDADGASAGELADELGIAKSTLSEHLSEATGAVFRQLFANAVAPAQSTQSDSDPHPVAVGRQQPNDEPSGFGRVRSPSAAGIGESD